MAVRNGFTLIELSIVLVIIGLIVGGILLGQDLIQAATIRAQVSQIEKLATSVNAFKIKYDYIPGDMSSVRAAQLGFFSISAPLGGTVGYQDGNGVISTRENFSFWRHLTDAQMIEGSYGTTASGNPLVAATGDITTSVNAGTVRSIMPPAKIGRGATLIMDTFGTEKNYLWINGLNGMSTAPTMYGPFDVFTPIEAQQVDVKMDDGMPWEGKVLGGDNGMVLCTASDNYDTGPANGNTPNCYLLVDIGF